MSRVIIAIFDVATFGSITQEVRSPAAGYLAFFSTAIYLIALALLPALAARSSRTELERQPSDALRIR